MGKKGYLVLAVITLLLIINSVIGAARCNRKNETLPTEEERQTESVPQIVPDVSGTEVIQVTASDMWAGGWQKATVIYDTLLYHDDGMSEPMDINAETGKTVVICQRTGDACRIRYRTEIGWVSEGALELHGEPVIFQSEAVESDPATVNGTVLAEKLDAIAKKHNCIGVQMALITDGQVGWTYEYGFGHRGNKTPMSSDTKLRVASVSKLIVGMGIMSMNDMGTVDIDADISEYWTSDIRNPSHKDKPITFRHILTHTSSMKDFGYKKRATSALESNLKLYTSYMYASPGSIEAYDYNNSAICAAGAIAGNASNCNFDRYIREYFFEPMNIDASFNASNIRQTELIAPTYNSGTTTMKVEDLLNITYNGGPADDYTLYAGGMIISAKDLASMVCILMNGGQYENMFYLSEDSISQMLTPYYELEDYSQCLVLRHKKNMYNGEDLYYHNGNLMGVYSLLCFNPDTGNGLVLVTNGADEPRLKNGVYSVCGDLAEAAVELWK